MATFTELCNDVYTITSRPDLVAETKLAVKAATLKLHQVDYWYKDINEAAIQFTAADYTQQVELKSIFPLFRSLSYLRRFSLDSSNTSSGGEAKEFYKIITPDNVVDSYRIDKVNVAYMAGIVCNIKSKELLQYALVGYYALPNVTEAAFYSWIADDHPYAIIFEAARLLFKQIGFDEQSATFEKLALEQVAELKISNTQAVGY